MHEEVKRMIVREPQWTTFQTALTPNLGFLPASLLAKASHASDLSALHEAAEGELPAIQWRNLATLIRRWRRWQATWHEARSFLEGLPPAVTDLLRSPDQIAALRRIQRLFSIPGLVISETMWLAALQIWEGCFRLAWKEALWQITAKEIHHPRLDHFADLVGKKEHAEEIPPHRWLAMERGLQEGVLSLSFRWPEDKLLSQIALARKALESAISERSAASVLQELVLDDLPSWMRWKIREITQDAATQTACQEYRDLLLTAPWKGERLVSLYVGHPRAPLGAVWLQKDGLIEDSLLFEAEKAALDRLLEALKKRPPQAIALPLRSADSERLNLLARELAKHFTIFRLREAGIAVAREAYLSKAPKGDRDLASALALAARLQEPLQAWGLIDPLHLGLADYQEQLDTERLKESLLDEKTIAGWASRPDPSLRPTAQAPSSRLNPLVRSLDDLKPGMVLQGLVSHLTDFGAFVHLGLPEEGLIHLSELADRFVRHPSEVIRAGQTLQPRVLSVDRDKRTISLTLRNHASPRTTQQTRAKHLQALDNLFKK